MIKENIKVTIVSRYDLIDQLRFQNNGVFCNEKFFEFDYLYLHQTNSIIYENCIKSYVLSSISGINNTIITYGKTKSGKSFSLGFDQNTTIFDDSENWGILQRSLKDFCYIIKQEKNSRLFFSFVEFENENIKDLIGDHSTCKIEEISDSIVLSNAIEEEITDFETAFSSFNLCFSRSSKNQVNKYLTLKLEKRLEEKIISSKFCLVDLACSFNTTYMNKDRKKGFKNFQAMLSLQNLINYFNKSADLNFLPYHSSNLTLLLKQAIGGNSRTLFYSCIPLQANVEEIFCVLGFLEKVKKIENTFKENISFSNSEYNSNANSKRKNGLEDMQKQISFLLNENFNLRKNLVEQNENLLNEKKIFEEQLCKQMKINEKNLSDLKKKNEIHENLKDRMTRIEQSTFSFNSQKTNLTEKYKEILIIENLNFDKDIEENFLSFKKEIENKISNDFFTIKKRVIKPLYHKVRTYGLFFNFRCPGYFSCKSINRKFSKCKKVYMVKYFKSCNKITIYESNEICCND
jgi:hypothetical protein